MLFNFLDASTFFAIDVLDVRDRRTYNCEV